MKNLIATVVILLVVGGALLYIIRAKKRGQNCIGCPYSKDCAGRKCNCNNKTETKSE